jgi:hypothetical protein
VDIGDGNLVNVTPLQLGEEVARIHCVGAKRWLAAR